MKTTLLCVLDGFGLNPNPLGNAVAGAKTPVISKLLETCPNSTLTTFGLRVGLPEGQMGNSEVGHLNIGAGRVVEQWLVRIGRELREDNLPRMEAYRAFLRNTGSSKQIHIIGLFSDGGVHSHREHLSLLIQRVAKDFSGEIVLHLITDGRDCSPETAIQQIPELLQAIKAYPNVRIGTICGRFFAMDRDKRWERTEKAYKLFVSAEGAASSTPEEALKASYGNKITDEFVEPVVLNHKGIHPDDGIIFWNFREDRMRQIVRSLCVKDFDGFSRAQAPTPSERVLCFTDYDKTFHLPYLFEPIPITNHLGETVSKQGLKQLRVAETEKYPHVTYFLNGGIEVPYPGEERKLVPSPRDVKTYDLKPEMSAYPVTDIVVEGILSGEYSLIVVNLANCDMVGHTGNYDAAVKAVETADTCLGKMLDALQSKGGQAVILADHGNAEQMINYEDGTPHTAHTTYPVPVIVVGAAGTVRSNGALCDVAPTVLQLMQISAPNEMSGSSLLQ